MPAIPAELLESFGNGPKTAEAINAASLAFKKALIERALDGELNHHLGYPSGTTKPTGATNQRNGKGAKRLEGQARSAGGRVPGHDAADLHCASDPQQPGLRKLERS